MECKNKRQRDKAFKIRTYDTTKVKSFLLRARASVKGVIRGIPLTEENECFLEVAAVALQRGPRGAPPLP